MRSKSFFYIGLLLVAVIATALGFYFKQTASKAAQPTLLTVATVFPEKRIMPNFDLQNDQGQDFNQDHLKGRWSVLFFGFTHCPHMCPATMNKLAQAYHALDDSGHQPLPTIIMISVDPKRDDVDTLHHYVKKFHPKFMGATGEEQTIQALTKALGVVHMKIAEETHPDHYTIEHSGTLFLINPKGQIHAVITLPYEAEQVVSDYQTITQAKKYA